MDTVTNEKGMAPALSDRDFYNLMTDNGVKWVELILKHYPELKVYAK